MPPDSSLIVDPSIRVDRPAEEVFEFVSNHEYYAARFPSTLSVKAMDSGKGGGVGTVYEETLRLPLRRQQAIKINAVNFETPHRFRSKGDFALLWPTMLLECEQISPSATGLRMRSYKRHSKADKSNSHKTG